VTTKQKGLKLPPKQIHELFYMEAISDSSLGGDKETRLSVYRYVYLCGAPINK
jgi:hypothetical protein